MDTIAWMLFILGAIIGSAITRRYYRAKNLKDITRLANSLKPKAGAKSTGT